MNKPNLLVGKSVVVAAAAEAVVASPLSSVSPAHVLSFYITNKD